MLERVRIPGIVIGAGISILLLFLLVLHVRPWDPRMPVRAAERALAAKSGGVRFHCRRAERDASIDPKDIKDVDYQCDALICRGREPKVVCTSAGANPVWIGTSWNRITEIWP